MNHVSRMAVVSVLVAAVAASAAVAAPPVAPAELKADVGRPTLLTVKVEAGKKLGTEKTYDPAALMLARLWTDDPNTYEFWVFPNANGTYFVPFWTEGETKGTVVKIVAGKGGVVPPPPPVDPVPPPTGDRFHFMIVRPGNVGIDPFLNAEIDRVLKLPAWKELKWKDNETHTVADWPFTGLKPEVQAKLKAQPMPFLLKWRYVGNEIHLVDATALPFPTTDTDVRSLLK